MCLKQYLKFYKFDSSGGDGDGGGDEKENFEKKISQMLWKLKKFYTKPLAWSSISPVTGNKNKLHD